jgi:Fe(3+) dicitrate transport protein
MKKAIISCSLLVALVLSSNAQQPDSVNGKNLDSVTVTRYLRLATIERLADVKGTYIFSGKKTEVINIQAMDIDIANKNARQAFAKVPGVFVYDMDGAGNQLNVASRGLDPHRGWDYNIRKDGIITNSDMYGYPASHFSMPLESISRIEIVRGTGSLQYGAQFGGMVNYVSKEGDSVKPFSFESINTIGSFNLLSTYNAIGGTIGKFRYYAYYSKKRRDGYRDVEHTDSEAQDIILHYFPSPKISLRLEWARSMYRYRIPGPLTDSMFNDNPREATRERNYFSPDIHVPSFNLNWAISQATRLELISSAVLGRRNSVLFDAPANIADRRHPVSGEYAARQVDIDQFRSLTNELRILHSYRYNRFQGVVTTGIQWMNNDLHRKQLGQGSTGTNYDLSLTSPEWGRDIHFRTNNVALFTESVLNIGNNVSVNAGFRMEAGKTDLDGLINYYPENAIPLTVKHRFPLFGAGFSYKAFPGLEFYGGWSQAYRPMIFKDLVPSSLYERVDPNIRDAKGYNIETGARTQFAFLKIDISTFILRYNNRFGILAQQDNNGAFISYRTNIGNSLTIGAELFIQADWLIGNDISMNVFTSSAFMDARYKGAVVKSGNQNIDIDGNKVESAPDFISRNGINFKYRRSSFSILYSYTGETFSDALNTEEASANGAVGLVPSYGLLDLSASSNICEWLEARVVLNNVLNKQYFTKRPLFYPGPGIWPSEGRNVNLSFIIRI